jgi:hypothetical protein
MKLAEANRLWVGSGNVGSLTEKLHELVDVAIGRRLNILCVQETGWASKKTMKVENIGFKLSRILASNFGIQFRRY